MWNSQSYAVREGSESLQYGLVTISQYEGKKEGQEHVTQKTIVYEYMYIIVMYHKSSFI